MRALWKPKPDLPTAAEAWLTAGGPHHTVLTAGLGVEALVDLADMGGLELLLIDERAQLRWNQAYYHLARGL
jgi:L-arabinose isomerase